jgi:hypothetical protein
VLANVPASATIPEMAAYSFTATATDADLPAQTVTFSLDTGAPAGATINASTGVFSWTPSEVQGPGDYVIHVRATDNGGTPLSSDETISVHVDEVNMPPILTGVPAIATIAELVLYSFSAAATDPDIPAQPLTYSVVSAPAGAAINASLGSFSWTPSESQGPGSYPFSVRVSDGVANTDAPVTLAVEDVNTAPVLAAIPDQSVGEGSLLSFVASATDADLPAQTLSFSLDAGAPAGASIDPGTGVFTWTPGESQGPGDYAVTVRVTDDGSPAMDDSHVVNIHVSEVNVAPVLANVPATATIPEQAPYTFTATATDADLPAQTLTFSLVGAPGGAGINPSTGQFSWTPDESQGGSSYPFTVRVSDGVTNTDSAINITVDESNAAPVLASVPATATIPEQAAYTFTATATDADVPAQPLTFSLVGAPGGAGINPTSGVFTWTPTETQGPGSYPFTVRVSDGIANTDAAITLTVTEVNVAPVLAAIGDRSVGEGTLLSFTATSTDADLPAQTLAYSLDAGAPSGAGIAAGTGVFNWTPGEAQGPGDYVVTVRVTDNGSPALDDFETFNIHVSDVNSPPTLSGVPATVTIPELVPYSFTATAADSDLPVQTLAFSLVGAPPGAAIDGGTGVFTWTPTEAQGPGTYPFSVRVSDGVVNTDAAITITVSEVTISAIANLAATPLVAGNDADGNTRISLAWSPTTGGTTVEVFRAPFGGYPDYDDAGGQVPVTPSYPPPAPWVLTSVTAPGSYDEPAARDFYYYVAFVHGAGANVSVSSNKTSGTLNYHLGDVSDGAVAGQGDNRVNTLDLSLLGSHYGLSGPAVAPYRYLDVGPTTDFSPNGRPTTDSAIDFEDLILFAIGFDAVSAPASIAFEEPAPSHRVESDAVTLSTVTRAVPGHPITVPITLSMAGAVKALSTSLEWDTTVVRPSSVASGGLVEKVGGIVLSPRPGTVDVAFLGTRQGFSGEGVVATVTFEVLAAGDPGIHIRSIDARGASNEKIAIAVGAPPKTPVIPAVTSLALASPNPFYQQTTLAFSLSQGGAVELAIFSVDGRRVRTLLRGSQEPGVYRLAWDGRDDHGGSAAAGVYYVRLQAAGRSYSRSIVNLR